MEIICQDYIFYFAELSRVTWSSVKQGITVRVATQAKQGPQNNDKGLYYECTMQCVPTVAEWSLSGVSYRHATTI